VLASNGIAASGAAAEAPPAVAPATSTHWGAAALLLALGWLALAWPWLSGAVTVPWDAKAHFQPQLQFLAQSLHSGQSPFWAPGVFGGHPQIADPQSLIFSPPYLLLALVSSSPSMAAADGVVFATLLLGAFAVLLIFRDRGWHEAGALVAAMAFAMGGAAAWRIQHTGQVLSLAYWPIAFLLLDRALRRSSWGYGAAAGAMAGFMLIGRDQVAYLGTLMLCGPVIGHFAGAPRKLPALRGMLAPLLAGAVAGLLVVTIPLLMTMSLAEASNRAAFDLASAERGSLHPASLLTAVVPHLFGIAMPLVDYWGPPSPDWGWVDLYLARNMATLYLGILPILAVLGLGLFRRLALAAEIRFFLICAVLLLLYTLGRYTPVFALYFHAVPGVDLFRRPADALFPLCAVLAIIGGYAIHRWLNDERVPTPRPVPLLELAIAIAVLAVSAWLASSVGRLGQALPAMGSAALFAIAAVLALWLARRHRHRRLAVLAGLALLMTVDLGVNNGPNESTALPTDTYAVLDPASQNSTITLLQQRLAGTAAPDRRDRVELVGLGFHWPNVSLVHGLDHTLGYNPIRLRDYSASVGARDHIAGPDQRLFTPLFPSYVSPLANLVGLRFIASSVPLAEVDKALPAAGLPLIARTADAYIYENTAALPRVLFTTAVAPADFATLMTDGRWPATDFARTVVLEPADAARHPGTGGTGRASILRYTNTDVRVSVTSDQGGILVLNDTWHPWWQVSVDGQPAELLRANVIMRAVAVPAGRHEVRFRFRPFIGLWRQWTGG
jgi:drug/metabolite transporter superfamily protein YnfA